MCKRALLLLAHGTPEVPDEVPEYLRYVTGGRPLPPHVVEEITDRYRQVGGSPLTGITRALAERVQKELGEETKVYFAMRNWHPFIGDVMGQMRADGVTEVAVICLAPQNSRTSVGLYKRAVEAESAGMRIDFTPEWHSHPLLIQAFAENLRKAWHKLSQETGQKIPVLFTAHSVPERTLQATEQAPADNYADQARETAQLVAEKLPELEEWEFAFQSQGQSGGAWIGPRVEEKLQTMADAGCTILMLDPIGFLADHVEILFDIDIDFRQKAKDLGMRLERPESLNDSELLARALCELAQTAFARLENTKP